MKIEDMVLTYSTYLKKKYGRKMFRIGLSTGISCPHRQRGGGCIFCQPHTFSNSYPSGISVREQLTQTIPTIQNKCGDVGLIAYFQEDTSTAGSPEKLREVFLQALDAADIKELVISTRPDYLGHEVLEVLKSIPCDVTVEIGMQTLHQKSLNYLKRGHDFDCVHQAIESCGKAGLEVGVHLMIGIPGETLDDMQQTFHYISDNNYIKQVKLHNMVIYKNTKLYEEYLHDKIKPLSIDEYIWLLRVLIQYLRGDIVLTRLFTSNLSRDGSAVGDIVGTKIQWTQKLARELSENNIVQGCKTALAYNSIKWIYGGKDA